jgi:dihydrodipicolinate synthase/N-acetylneuraminate lyase
MAKSLLQADEIKGVYAIVPTPAKEGADHWSATDTVDVEESARMVDKLIGDGVGGLIALGTTGECATLTRSEWETFAGAVVETAAGRVPTFIGATALGTHEIIDRLKFVRDLGATGSMLGLPMWQPCTDDMAVRLFADVSEALPDLAIMVYMNSRAFRYEFPVHFWERIAKEAPTVTSAKYTRGTPYLEALKVGGGKINFLPIDMGCLEFAQMAPDDMTATWSTAASMGPQPAVALMDAITAKDWDKAKAIDTDIKWANETFIPPDPMEFAFYNIQIEKLRMAAAGYCKPGPIRPPYQIVPAEHEKNAAECGRRWAELVHKYADVR